MKFNYDRVADAVYLNVGKGKIKETVEMNNSVIVDVGNKGRIIGIEILNFSHQQSNKNDFINTLENGVPMRITEAAPKIA
ncbi:MAG: DUF2283 domain-containing protein [Candidatus Paceibacterota bacterium]